MGSDLHSSENSDCLKFTKLKYSSFKHKYLFQTQTIHQPPLSTKKEI